MSEWKEILLEKLANEITVGFVGSMTEEYQESGIPFLRSKNVEPYRIKWEDIRFISKEFNKKLKKSALKPGDVVIIRTGKPGAACLIPDTIKEANCSDLVIVRPNSQLDKHFLVYYLNSSASHHINSHLVGAVQQHFNIGSARKLKIKLPPLDEQKQIASVLSCLDDKIENLRKQNQTLEQIAQTLFKHWFIDFEFPDEKGNPYKSSGGAMKPSELGEIPEHWRVGKLEDIITVNPTESIKKGSLVKYIEMKALSTSSMEINDYIEREVTFGSKFRNGDTLLARITPCLENGKTGFVNILEQGEVAFGSTEFIVLRAKENCCPEYVYPLARSPYFRDIAIKNMTGSSGRQRVPNDVIANYKLPIPNNNIMKLYQEIANPLFVKITANQKQIQNLTKTRDTLLPKLMSGKLRVKEENIIEEGK